MCKVRGGDGNANDGDDGDVEEEVRVFVPKLPRVHSNFRHSSRQTQKAAGVSANTPPMTTSHLPKSSVHSSEKRDFSFSLTADESHGDSCREGTAEDVAVETRLLLGTGCRHSFPKDERGI